jgi:hypothetical protein
MCFPGFPTDKLTHAIEAANILMSLFSDEKCRKNAVVSIARAPRHDVDFYRLNKVVEPVQKLHVIRKESNGFISLSFHHLHSIERVYDHGTAKFEISSDSLVLSLVRNVDMIQMPPQAVAERFQFHRKIARQTAVEMVEDESVVEMTPLFTLFAGVA